VESYPISLRHLMLTTFSDTPESRLSPVSEEPVRPISKIRFRKRLRRLRERLGSALKHGLVVKSALSHIFRNKRRHSRTTRVDQATEMLPNLDQAEEKTVSEPTLECEKCAEAHRTEECPYYSKPRDTHTADASPRSQAQDMSVSNVIVKGRLVRQPGDGSCLFHALAYGASDGSDAWSLRQSIASFLVQNPSLKICDTALEDWIRWDSGMSVNSYARIIRGSVWGGGVEMACFSVMTNRTINVFVSRRDNTYKLISSFRGESGSLPSPSNNDWSTSINVVYQGRMHYDSLTHVETLDH